MDVIFLDLRIRIVIVVRSGMAVLSHVLLDLLNFLRRLVLDGRIESGGRNCGAILRELLLLWLFSIDTAHLIVGLLRCICNKNKVNLMLVGYILMSVKKPQVGMGEKLKGKDRSFIPVNNI